MKRFIEFGNYGVMDIIQFILVLLFSYKLIIISIFFYPHATFFIQTTWLYKKVFGSTWGVVTSGLSKYLNIGKSIPDDYHFRSSSRSYTVSSGYKTKRERVRDMQSTYLIYLFFKFFLKDLTLRMFTHFGVFVISPILFLIAILSLIKGAFNKYREITFIHKIIKNSEQTVLVGWLMLNISD
ncbi:hypothetical protein [Bacillus sp. JCM 19034]|uniref:hypothetical protein n=1 Tax=Bacillus sp. JCM 19034 TaxID=1481928 RepID=UPI0018D1B6D7|nr:hypothetical protein [Bacillus sp. JCM 19034]